MIRDKAGNLYGATYDGGASDRGVVFKVAPGGKETVLYSFAGTTDGGDPNGGLVRDAAGNLYGTTSYGGDSSCYPQTNGCGVVFKLSKAGSGDGKVPCCLIRDASWNLYGTNRFGGAYGYGTAFELTRNGGGNWTETVLHDFNQDGKDGWTPGPLTLGKPGNVFGSSNWGGPPGCGDNHGCGIVYQLTKGGNGKWSEKILHTFKNDGKDGNGPTGLVVDKAGNLFGATDNGGTQCNPGGCGIAFELEHGTWTEKVLYNFYDKYSFPYPNLSLYKGRNLYGVTLQGGKYGGGTVFELTP